LEASGMMALAEDLTQIGLTLTEIELPQSSPLVGHTVGDVELSGGFVVVAIKRADASLHRAPESTVTLMTGDSFVILGHLAAVPQLARQARPATTMYRGAKT
jgi:voltage-gated potassium channel